MIELIQDRLASYHAANQLEEEYAVKEILQDIALYGLWRAGFSYHYLDFPMDFEVCHQDLSSNFALKIHALLCRPYLKGRDWYDFNWYMKQGVQPNLSHLASALFQWGPWAGQETIVHMEWLKHALTEKIGHVNWQEVAVDVERFLRPKEQHGLKLWSERFFLHKIERL